jgi:Flp pilus assembly protein TadD
MLAASIRRPSSRALGIVAAVVCLVAAAYLAGTRRDEQRLKQASAAGRRGDYASAIADARKVTRAPAAAHARSIEAFAQLGARNPRAAAAAFAAAAKDSPNDWAIRRGWALALLGAGRRHDALRQLARAIALNPGMALPAGFHR